LNTIIGGEASDALVAIWPGAGEATGMAGSAVCDIIRIVVSLLAFAGVQSDVQQSLHRNFIAGYAIACQILALLTRISACYN
jgi:hypothetical protein